MTKRDLMLFLDEGHYAAVATTRRDGSPVVTPLGYLCDGEFFYFSIRNSRYINRRLVQSPRIAFAIFTNEYPTATVQIEGTAELIDDPSDTISRSLVRRWIGRFAFVDIDAYERSWLAWGRSVYRVTPTQITAWDGRGQRDALRASDATPYPKARKWAKFALREEEDDEG